MTNQQCSLKNLAAKMIHVMREVEFIQKNGFNKFYQYKYATEADVAAALSHAMEKHNIFMFSSVLDRQCEKYQTRSNKEAFLITVKLQVVFIDADSGETFISTFFGDGAGSDDKGVYKAITGAQKYALMKTFLVESGDDPERNNQREMEQQAPAQVEKEKIELVSHMEAKARLGTSALHDAWSLLSIHQRDLVRERIGIFQQLAKQADQYSNGDNAP